MGAPTITRHYDADGNLTGWWEEESPWDDLDREKALAWHSRELSRCQGCGVPKVDVDARLGGDPAAWWSRSGKCDYCAENEQKNRQVEKNRKHGQRGVHVRQQPNYESPFWKW